MKRKALARIHTHNDDIFHYLDTESYFEKKSGMSGIYVQLQKQMLKPLFWARKAFHGHTSDYTAQRTRSEKLTVAH